jgi:glucose/arabinose dehydrogenase
VVGVTPLVKLAVIGTVAAGAALTGSGGGAAGAEKDRGVQIPPGYRIATVASGIPNASNIAFDHRGGIWVTSAAADYDSKGSVWYVRRPHARPKRVIGPLHAALGLTWLRGKLYVSSVAAPGGGAYAGRVTAYSRFNGHRFKRHHVVLDGIPVGEHRVDSIAHGPGGRLFLGVGSEKDRARGHSRLSGSVISFRPDGSRVRVVAAGFRNPYGLAFLPGTPKLFVSDNGIDFPGNRPPDELNVVDVSRHRANYGFPRCYDQGGPRCRGTRPPLARLDPHAAACGVAVSRDFGRLRGNVFVAEYGSTPGFGTHLTGARIVRVRLRHGRVPRRAKARVFAHGFHHPDPVGLTIGSGGALYATLWSSGKVIRIRRGRP